MSVSPDFGETDIVLLVADFSNSVMLLVKVIQVFQNHGSIASKRNAFALCLFTIPPRIAIP